MLSIMINSELIAKLQERYNHVMPLIFHRSVERARSAGDLFDILETMPKNYPIIWDDESHMWIVTNDLLQSLSFVNKKKH